MAFKNRLRLEIITDTDNKLKLRVVMDLLAKTITTPPKIILNSKYLPRNLKQYTVTQVIKRTWILSA